MRREYRMGHRPDPETGIAHRGTRVSLFNILLTTVALATLLNYIVNQIPRVAEWGLPRWAVVLGSVVAVASLVYLYAYVDDKYVGKRKIAISLLLLYAVHGRKRRVEIGVRRSYPVTREARQAWATRFKNGLALSERKAERLEQGEVGEPVQKKPKPRFTTEIQDEHLALVRHLLAVYLARYGRHTGSVEAIHSPMRLEIPGEDIPWEKLQQYARKPGADPRSMPLKGFISTLWADAHSKISENAFSKSIGQSCPERFFLPEGTLLEAFDEGETLLRLTWHPPRLRGLWWVLTMGRVPRGVVRIRWLAPLSEIPKNDRRYVHLTTRAKHVQPDGEFHVVFTRLVIEVETRWNFLRAVGRFRDWGLNLARHLQREVDYWNWREYYLERNIDDLDWKIGYIDKKKDEPGLAERLRRMDDRLARLEEHLWPDEPPEGGSEGVWLSGDADPGADA